MHLVLLVSVAFFPSDALPTWPRILLEVLSLDSWDRHRAEGYGYTDLPNRPGNSTEERNCFSIHNLLAYNLFCIVLCICTLSKTAVCVSGEYDITVHMWRPSGIRVLDKMKRFFVGGAPEVDDVSFVAQPRDFEVSDLVH